MIIRRRVWYYRLPNQRLAHPVSFSRPVTAQQAMQAIIKKFSATPELWAGWHGAKEDERSIQRNH